MDLPRFAQNSYRSIKVTGLIILLAAGVAWSGNLKAQTVATPTISPSTNSSYVQFSVTVSDATAGAGIYYTLDGSTPTTSSSAVTSGGTVLIAKTETLNVKGFLSGYTASAVASATYTLGQVAAGQYHTVALRTDGAVLSWGYNSYGQIGDNTTTQRNSAVSVTISGTPISGYIAVAAGAYHSVALKNDNTVWAWGLNSSGQCGDNTTTNRHSPVEV